MGTSIMERLHAINPTGYLLSPKLSEGEKAANRVWVAQQRAKNAKR